MPVILEMDTSQMPFTLYFSYFDFGHLLDAINLVTFPNIFHVLIWPPPKCIISLKDINRYNRISCQINKNFFELKQGKAYNPFGEAVFERKSFVLVKKSKRSFPWSSNTASGEKRLN